MAKQLSGFIEGTIDDITFYKMEGKYYARMKSSLKGKRFWKDAAFKRSRKSSERFGEGNKIASKIYRMVEKEKRVYSLYCFLKRRAVLLLKEERSLLEVEALLRDYVLNFGLMDGVPKEVVNRKGQNRNSALINPISYENWRESSCGMLIMQSDKYVCCLTLVSSNVFEFRKRRDTG